MDRSPDRGLGLTAKVTNADTKEELWQQAYEKPADASRVADQQRLKSLLELIDAWSDGEQKELMWRWLQVRKESLWRIADRMQIDDPKLLFYKAISRLCRDETSVEMDGLALLVWYGVFLVSVVYEAPPDPEDAPEE